MSSTFIAKRYLGLPSLKKQFLSEVSRSTTSTNGVRLFASYVCSQKNRQWLPRNTVSYKSFNYAVTNSVLKDSNKGYYRSYSLLSEDTPAKIYEYQQIKKLSQSEHPGVVLVDVREPEEYKQGTIPTAVNIPFKSSPGALDLDPEIFEETFGFPKPSLEDELIFFCLAGVRSSASENLAATFGYKKRGNYLGSYGDWAGKETPSDAASSDATPDSETQRDQGTPKK